jgi:hypothetical protein
MLEINGFIRSNLWGEYERKDGMEGNNGHQTDRGRTEDGF